MTDNEIIKALEICCSVDIGECRDCPYKNDSSCINKIQSDALDLINRLTLPCKVGDEVWAIRPYRHTKVPVKGKVTEMYYIDESMRLCIVVKGVSRGEWGKMIFPDFESADKYLRGEGNVR